MLRYLMIAFMLSAVPLDANANVATSDDVRKFVDTVGQKVISTLNAQTSEDEKQTQLRQLFAEYVDMDWMGRFVLGHAWTQATEDQRNRYLQAYREYLLDRYTSNFSEYTGSKYTITGVKNESDGQYSVDMNVKSPKADQEETLAGYRVRTAGNGQFKITDIIVEGVSLITTQRSDFASVVQRDGMDSLITQLQSKAT